MDREKTAELVAQKVLIRKRMLDRARSQVNAAAGSVDQDTLDRYELDYVEALIEQARFTAAHPLLGEAGPLDDLQYMRQILNQYRPLLDWITQHQPQLQALAAKAKWLTTQVDPAIPAAQLNALANFLTDVRALTNG